MPRIPCFLLTCTDLCQLSLRRYRNWSDNEACAHGSYHDACVVIGTAPFERNIRGNEKPDLTDPRWPTRCQCGYIFQEGDHWQLFRQLLWKREDTGEVYPLRDAPAGAMWYADWLQESYHGPDGKCLVVKTPGGDWIIDSEASNCTRQGDLTHRCWIRHGEVPRITVDKLGETCTAGAGSIGMPGYHGFLRDGFLIDA